MSTARKLRRRTERVAVPPLVRVMASAAHSLELSDEQSQDAILSLLGKQPETPTSDMVMARTLDLLDELGNPPADADQERLQLEARNGAGFLERVSRAAKPVSASMLASLRALLFVLLVLVWPAAAAAHENAAKAVFETRIRYRRGNRQNFARRSRKAYHFRSWTRQKRSFGPSGRRSTSRSAFETGCGPGHANCDSRGLTSRSSWFGGAGAFASATSRAMTRISRSNCRTARSNARLTCEVS